MPTIVETQVSQEHQESYISRKAQKPNQLSVSSAIGDEAVNKISGLSSLFETYSQSWATSKSPQWHTPADQQATTDHLSSSHHPAARATTAVIEIPQQLQKTSTNSEIGPC